MSGAVPGLCRLIKLPLRWLPRRVKAGAAALMLNHLLAHALADDALAFLDGKVLAIVVDDLRIRVHLELADGVVAPAATAKAPDLSLQGDMHSLLQLATQRIAVVELLTARRLAISGGDVDTERLLEFLSQLGSCALPSPALQALRDLADRYGSRCGAVVAVDLARQRLPAH